MEGTDGCRIRRHNDDVKLCLVEQEQGTQDASAEGRKNGREESGDQNERNIVPAKLQEGELDRRDTNRGNEVQEDEDRGLVEDRRGNNRQNEAWEQVGDDQGRRNVVDAHPDAAIQHENQEQDGQWCSSANNRLQRNGRPPTKLQDYVRD